MKEMYVPDGEPIAVEKLTAVWTSPKKGKWEIWYEAGKTPTIYVSVGLETRWGEFGKRGYGARIVFPGQTQDDRTTLPFKTLWVPHPILPYEQRFEALEEKYMRRCTREFGVGMRKMFPADDEPSNRLVSQARVRVRDFVVNTILMDSFYRFGSGLPVYEGKE